MYLYLIIKLLISQLFFLSISDSVANELHHSFNRFKRSTQMKNGWNWKAVHHIFGNLGIRWVICSSSSWTAWITIYYQDPNVALLLENSSPQGQNWAKSKLCYLHSQLDMQNWNTMNTITITNWILFKTKASDLQSIQNCCPWLHWHKNLENS